MYHTSLVVPAPLVGLPVVVAFSNVWVVTAPQVVTGVMLVALEQRSLASGAICVTQISKVPFDAIAVFPDEYTRI